MIFLENYKPLFCEQKASTNSIIFIENNDIVDDDKLISEIFSEYFKNAVKNVNIEPYESLLCNDIPLIEI